MKRQHSQEPSRKATLMRRTALARSEKRMKRTPLRRVGRRGLAHRERMNELRPVVFARALWRCEAKFSAYCTTHAENAHHVLPTERGGPDTLENLIAVCRPCHDHIHNGAPIEAGRLGLLRGRDAGR